MKLNISHAHGTESGYGRLGTYLHRAFQDLGVQVDEGIHKNEPELPAHRNALWLGTPTHVRGWWKGQRAHVFTMWEATDLPPGFRENLHEFDTVFVPSEQNLELFSQFHPNVVKVPLAVDWDLWHYQPRPPVEKEFRFITAGQGTRKGIDLTVAAFKAVFGGYVPSANDPIPKLIVKNRVAQQDVRGERISQISGTMSDQDEVDLYATAHCYVGAARGEGWGLMPFQAICQGIPTILTDAHGQHEFAHLGIPVSAHLSKADYFIYGDAGQWWDADFDELCAAMWEVYTDYDAHSARAKRSSDLACDKYSWHDSATKIIKEIGPLSLVDEDDPAYRKWHMTECKLFACVTNKDCEYEINGERFLFRKGVLEFTSGDVKRMVFENGNLDPSCIDPLEEGVLADQVEKIGADQARAALCPTCHQPVNGKEWDEELVSQILLGAT